ncbi:MAG: DUF1501 domain-containing protein [Acidobacteria bacterium]|nr:DUF1501 domain-containing protein [Acidobacteriota bacterium]
MPNLLDNFLTRREMFRVGATSVGAYSFSPLLQTQARAAQSTKPRNSARFVIWVMLDGGASHVDTWDLKQGPWTPPDFDVQELQPGLKWPIGLFPQLAKQLPRTALVRSLEAWDSVHGRAQYYVQSAHSLNPALHKEIPSVGSVVAMEWLQRRRPTDSLPSYVALNVTQNQAGLLKSGFLPALHSPFHIQTQTSLSAYAVENADEKAEFQRRWALLKDFDARLRNDSSLQAKAYRDYNDHYESAVRLLVDPRTAPLFQLSKEEKARYGSSPLGDACLIARNLVEADSGTHFIFLQQPGWDHHSDIYQRKNIYKQCAELDPALSNLLEDLATRKRPDGRSLLDETLVISAGEFGRTPGLVSAGLKGRDHYQYAFSGLFAGGGVKGGQIIGKTNEDGSKVLDAGWGAKRSIYMEDIATTIYSAMGIDWRKKITGTPSGRDFYYIEPFAAQKMIVSREIEPLFG